MSDAKPEILSGKWHNQLGSELELNVAADGRVNGRFRSAVGLAPPDHFYTLSGFASGDLVTFCVSFGEGGVASWTGQLTEREGLERLATLWHLAHDIPDEEEARWLWSSVRAGSDVFIRS